MLDGGLQAAVPVVTALQRDADCRLHVGANRLRCIGVLRWGCWTGKVRGRKRKERGSERGQKEGGGYSTHSDLYIQSELEGEGGGR